MEEYKKDDRGRSKAKRLTQTDPHEKVDSSTWTPSAPENAGVKTGARPLVKRLFKKGGKVIGNNPIPRADRKPRKSGGRTEHKAPWVDDLINRDVRMANDKREGVKHEGAFKKGGKAKKAGGGGTQIETIKHPIGERPKGIGWVLKQAGEQTGKDHNVWSRKYQNLPKPSFENSENEKIGTGLKLGGRTNKFGGGMIGNNPVSDQNKAMGKAAGPMKKGGRTKRADGGDAIADYLNKNPEQPRGMPGRGLPATGAPIYHGAEDKHNFMPDTNLTTQGKKKGGKVEHEDVAEDKALIKRMVKPEARTGRKSGGETMHHKDCTCHMCSGGRTMKYAGGGVFSGNPKEKNPGEVGGRKAHAKGGRTKGTTTINIVMAPRGGQDQASMPNAPVMPPKPPMGVPVPPPQMAGGAPPMGGMPPQMPPQMPGRATGGRTRKMVGGSLGNAGGMQPMQQPMQQPMMGQPMQPPMGYPMPRKSGGRTGYPIDSGAGGGNARLEKIEAYGLKPRGK